MSEAPLVSVIMPCHNAADTIRYSINSLLQQTVRRWQLVIVDDGSTDQSLDYPKSLADPRILLLSQSHQGVCEARNLGLERAAGQYIVFLDADDSLLPEFLAEMTACLDAHTESALVYCGWKNVGLTGAEPYVPPEYQGANKLPSLLRETGWHIASAITRKDAIEQAGGFEPQFQTSEDFLLWLKIASHHPITRLPKVLANYHHHDGPRATDNQLKMAFNHWRAQRFFVQHYPQLLTELDESMLAELIEGRLRERGFDYYWKRNLEPAHAIFRKLLKLGYRQEGDLKQLLPALLPLFLYRSLIRLGDRFSRSD